MKSLSFLTILAALALTAVGCGSDSGGVMTESINDGNQLVGLWRGTLNGANVDGLRADLSLDIESSDGPNVRGRYSVTYTHQGVAGEFGPGFFTGTVSNGVLRTALGGGPSCRIGLNLDELSSRAMGGEFIQGCGFGSGRVVLAR